METRADAIIVLDSTHSCRSLKMIEAWVNSSLVVKVFPDVVYAGMKIRLGDTNTGKYGTPVSGFYHPTNGYWHFYIPRTYIKYGGDTMYEIDATDIENSSRHVCGDGILRIRSAALASDDDTDEESTSNAYVKYGSLWYLIDVGSDEDGNLMLRVNSVSSEDVPADVSGTPYAYCKQTGLYHAISVATDDSGSVMLQVNGTGVDGDDDSFVYNPTTKLYYRLEADTDDTDSMMIQIGDQQ